MPRRDSLRDRLNVAGLEKLIEVIHFMLLLRARDEPRGLLATVSAVLVTDLPFNLNTNLYALFHR